MSGKNFFQFFGLPISYSLDEAALMRVYLERQREFHPDSVVADNCINSCAGTSVAELNTAYQVLMNPIDRAEHYLNVLGMQTLDQLPSDFAEEMFSMRQKFDSLQTESEKKEFCASLNQRMADIISLLHGLKEDELEKFGRYACLLRFINSFLEKVELNAYSRN